MPTSNLATWPAILNLIELAPEHDRILDVGPGYGKAGLLLREYLNTKPSTVDAVEAWPGYVTDRMRCIYDDVLVCNVLDLDPKTLASYDLVLMADVIEHIQKPEALKLLDRIPGYVVVSTPMDFFHNGHGLPPTEDHVSHWTLEDFGDRVQLDGSMLGGLIIRLNKL